LGGEGFLEGVKQHIKKRKDDREIPGIQKRPTFLTWEKLLERVAKYYRVETGDLLKRTYRPSEARRVSIYLSRRELGLRLGEIGKKFELGYTGVSRCVTAVSKSVEKDAKFRKNIEKIISNIKVKT